MCTCSFTQTQSSRRARVARRALCAKERERKQRSHRHRLHGDAHVTASRKDFSLPQKNLRLRQGLARLEFRKTARNLPVHRSTGSSDAYSALKKSPKLHGNMIASCASRFISTNNILWQSTNKSLLAKLRKKTGYTFANCKKALELNDNDLTKAENWLKEQAQALGWSKAEKLQGRSTSQGLIAVILNQCHGALIEINCETDFVARNKQFHELADTVASAVLKHTVDTDTNGIYNKSILDADALKTLPAPDGKTIGDHSALTIGTLGENISVRRALCMYVPSDVILTGYSHPAPAETGPTLFGKYGALLAFKTSENKETIGKQLCQHIIGMNPTKIGDPEVDQPNKNSDDETTLIHQEFLLDSSMTVQQVLQETNTKILDFARFEMGEMVEGQQSLDAVETGG